MTKESLQEKITSVRSKKEYQFYNGTFYLRSADLAVISHNDENIIGI